MWYEEPSKQDREAVAQILRLRAARGSEAIAAPPEATKTLPAQHQWYDLRHIACIIERLTAPDRYDRAKQDWSVSRLREIADVLEDMYEQNRDH